MHRSKDALLKVVKAIGMMIALFGMYGSSGLARADNSLQSEIVVNDDLSYSMEDAGVESRIIYYETGGHGFWNRDFRGHKSKMVRFFMKKLKGRKSDCYISW